MPTTYGELNLKEIRDKVGLDFAHFTYLKGMCSCCYFSYDLPVVYWRGKTKEEKLERCRNAEDGKDYTFLLFKNADNGSGIVKKSDSVCFPNKKGKTLGEPQMTYIGWSMSSEQLERTCNLLQSQLGLEYRVIKPANETKAIGIEYIGKAV